MILSGRHLLVTVELAWYDLWVGAYIDRKNLRLFICPLPCVLVCIQPALHSRLRRWFAGPQAHQVERWRRGAAGYLGSCWQLRRWPQLRELVRMAVKYEQAERLQRWYLTR